MRTSIKVARGFQIVGAILLIMAIVGISGGALGRGGEVGWKIALGLIFIIGPRIYEWFSKE